jgi:hypothetical protein
MASLVRKEKKSIGIGITSTERIEYRKTISIITTKLHEGRSFSKTRRQQNHMQA